MGIRYSFTKAKHPDIRPIPVPTAVLEEVLSFLPRVERARLVLVSRQAADAIVPGVNAERQKVSSCLLESRY